MRIIQLIALLAATGFAVVMAWPSREPQATTELVDPAIADTSGAPAASTRPAEEMGVGKRRVHARPVEGEVRVMSVRELGNFEYDAGDGKSEIPADVVRLNGLNVRLSGYMIPMTQAGNVTKFMLVPSIYSCCFGQPPTVQHTVFVTCAAGKTIEYSPDRVLADGRLTVKETKEAGYVVSLFELNCTRVTKIGQ